MSALLPGMLVISRYIVERQGHPSLFDQREWLSTYGPDIVISANPGSEYVVLLRANGTMDQYVAEMLVELDRVKVTIS